MSGSTSNPYSGEIDEIENASSIGDIDAVMSRFSAVAPAGADGAALYCGWIGGANANPIVSAVANDTDLAMIGKTPFGKFLGNDEVADATQKALTRIYKAGGSSAELAEAQAKAYIYGDGTQTPGLTRNADSLWGSRSKIFVESVNGPITVIGTSAPDDRILPDVELQAALSNPDVTAVGGIPADVLRARVAAANGNYKAVLGDIQVPFRDAVDAGVYRDGSGHAVFSREAAQELGFANSAGFQPAAVLDARPDLTAVPLDAVPSYIGSHTPASLPTIDPLASSVTPAEDAMLRHLDPADRAALTAPGPVDPTAAALAATNAAGDPVATGPVDGPGVTDETAPSKLGKIVGGAGNALTALQLAKTAIDTAGQYEALEQNGNTFAANNLLRTQAIDTIASTAGSFGGGFAAGSTYAAIAGSESGPADIVVSLAGGFVGGVVGKAFGSDIAEYLTERDIKLNKGTDGETYQFLNGSWQTTHSWYDPLATDHPAPASQIPTLEAERATTLTELAMQNSSNLDPNKISAKDDAGHMQSWMRTGPGQWEALSTSGSDFKVEKASPAVTSQLEQQSALRTAIGPNAADFAAKGFVVDYYGQHWDAVKPMPDAVVSQLHLQSETKVTDPSTGITWNVDGSKVTRVVLQSQENAVPTPATQTQTPQQAAQPPTAKLAPQAGVTPTTAATPAAGTTNATPTVASSASPAGTSKPVPDPTQQAAPDPMVTVTPTPAEYARIMQARDAAVASNRAYGTKLIAQEYAALKAANAAGVPYIPGTTPATPATPTQSPAPATATASATGLSDPANGGAVTPDPIIVQARVEALRAAGVNLPDVTNVLPYSPLTTTGSFVHVDDDTVAQHLGRGTYQVASVSQNLNGQTPPEGQLVTKNPQGQVASPPPPVQTRSYGRME